MLRTPYIPTAYPDETFGSLLTRLVVYNGTGLWRSLLEDSGYGRRTISPFYAMPVRDERLERLLKALGRTYLDTLHQLTALPFWLAFNNASRLRDRISVDTGASGGTRLFLVGKEHTLPGARYCPACLVDDLQTYGEPYLHRHHQLPVAMVCAKHGVHLRLTCKACGVTSLPFNKALLEPPALRCRCGQDLTRPDVLSPGNRSAFRRLSQFAADTLTCAEAPWTAQHVRAVLSKSQGWKDREFRRRSLELIQGAYGPTNLSASALHITVEPQPHEEIPLRLGAKADLFRAPEFCALISAAGMTFEEFKLAANSVQVALPPRARVVQRPSTLMQAELEFDRLARESSDRPARRLQQSSPRLYWLLRLEGSGRLERNGSKFQRSIPSVAADRTSIECALSKTGRSLRQLRNSGPWIRAHLRDNSWLQERLCQQRSSDMPSETKAQRRQLERAHALSRAVFSVLRAEQRPKRIHAGLLARVVQITMHQAQDAISKSPPLQRLIAAVNTGKDRRTAAWAARTMFGLSSQPTVKDVIVRAGLNTTRVNRQLVIAAIDKLTTRASSI